MIEVIDLMKKYGSHTAVDHISFTIEGKKIYGLLGPNGAGKTTIMNILTGYLQPTGGTVRIDGIDIQKKAVEAKKKIGYLPEIPPLYPDMTVKEYLEFTAGLKKIERKKKKTGIIEAMELTGIREYQNVLIRKLSKGYKQRVGLAQAILGFPEIIILDEPTVGLDPKQITEIRKLIRLMAKEHTVILSSHILSEVQELCDEIMIISEGKLIAQDTPEELEQQQENRQCLILVAKGEKEQIEELLKSAEDIGSFRYQEERKEKELCYEITAKTDCDIREKLYFLFADHRIPILELAEHKLSLEEVFLNLTSGDMEEEIDDSSI